MSERHDVSPEARLGRVIYRSHSRLPDAADEQIPAVAEILRVARRNNAASGLTGVLLFDGTTFMQAIEGEIGQLETLYEEIACDPRHEDIEVIEFKPIAARDYSSFPMAYLDGLNADRDTLRQLVQSLATLPPRS
jgi:hypothetical protein